MTQIIPGEYKDARFRKGHVVTPEAVSYTHLPAMPGKFYAIVYL